MNSLILLLKWFFIPRGTTKVHPYALLSEKQRLIAENLPILKYKAGYRFRYLCEICGQECFSVRKVTNPPVCLRFHCFNQYYSK